MEREIYLLQNWKFALGENREAISDWEEVSVPHTWNIAPESEESYGTGWYRYEFQPQEEWKNRTVLVYFHAIYHDAHVYINGIKRMEHVNSGYTPFTVDLTNYLLYGEKNSLEVRVENSYSPEMLPYKRSFDWANDGGIIRDVEFIITGSCYISTVKTTAKPLILTENVRQEAGSALIGIDFSLGGNVEAVNSLEWELLGETQNKDTILYSGSVPCVNGKITAVMANLSEVSYWHFDSPVLYTLNLRLCGKTGAEDILKKTIGFRDFHTEGTKFYLNGEFIRICGTEWMPGSDPRYGNAEPKRQLEKMLTCLKQSNCIFTRFHWQQDDFVYDWCDRHGMLVQEEIPFWGGEPETIGEQQYNIFCQQAEEMLNAHSHHPSIISWAVGNELNAQKEETIHYIKTAITHMKTLDSTRPVNYVSNTYLTDAARDGTIYGDILMINEYAGTWMSGINTEELIKKILPQFPKKPLVPSEFGLCEPAFSGGDQRREEIFKEKMNTYRKYPQIAGTINFCLNDYRTHIGEHGKGKFRSRIHGSTDLTGTTKPSYYTVQKECAPFTIERTKETLKLTCRADIPCYTIKGYTAQILNENMQTIKHFSIPNLNPGETYQFPIHPKHKISIFRPTGAPAGTY